MPNDDGTERRARATGRVPSWLLAISLPLVITSVTLLVGGSQTDGTAATAPKIPVAAVPVDPPEGGSAGRVRVRVRPAAADAPLNVNHAWVVSVVDRSGAPVTGCEPELDAVMPEHGHGLPTAPRATRELRAGEHLVEGVRFSMPGYWRLSVVLRGCVPEQRSEFDLRL